MSGKQPISLEMIGNLYSIASIKTIPNGSLKVGIQNNEASLK